MEEKKIEHFNSHSSTKRTSDVEMRIKPQFRSCNSHAKGLNLTRMATHIQSNSPYKKQSLLFEDAQLYICPTMRAVSVEIAADGASHEHPDLNLEYYLI